MWIARSDAPLGTAVNLAQVTEIAFDSYMSARLRLPNGTEYEVGSSDDVSALREWVRQQVPQGFEPEPR